MTSKKWTRIRELGIIRLHQSRVYATTKAIADRPSGREVTSLSRDHEFDSRDGRDCDSSPFSTYRRKSNIEKKNSKFVFCFLFLFFGGPAILIGCAKKVRPAKGSDTGPLGPNPSLSRGQRPDCSSYGRNRNPRHI